MSYHPRVFSLCAWVHVPSLQPACANRLPDAPAVVDVGAGIVVVGVHVHAPAPHGHAGDVRHVGARVVVEGAAPHAAEARREDAAAVVVGGAGVVVPGARIRAAAPGAAQKKRIEELFGPSNEALTCMAATYERGATRAAQET